MSKFIVLPTCLKCEGRCKKRVWHTLTNADILACKSYKRKAKK